MFLHDYYDFVVCPFCFLVTAIEYIVIFSVKSYPFQVLLMLQLITIPKESNENRFVNREIKICITCGSSNICHNDTGIFCRKCGDVRQYELEKEDGYKL